MQQDFAGARPLARDLLAVEIDQAEIVRRQVVLADQRRRADHLVRPDAVGDVAAVAIDILAVPELLADRADLRFDRFGFGRGEEASVRRAAWLRETFARRRRRDIDDACFRAAVGAGSADAWQLKVQTCAVAAGVAAPVTISISLCRRKSRADGVMTPRSATRTWVAPAATADCASRSVSTFSPEDRSSSLHVLHFGTSASSVVFGVASEGVHNQCAVCVHRDRAGQKGFAASRPSVKATIWPSGCAEFIDGNERLCRRPVRFSRPGSPS